MALTLRAISLDDQPLTRPITAHFDAHGGTIGRADTNVMALPDPERHISRQQARISHAGGLYRITNVGSANPIRVRGQTLAQGDSLPLMHRDQVRIGGYLLEVSEDHEDELAAHTILRGRAAIDARTGGAPPTPEVSTLPEPFAASMPAAAAAPSCAPPADGDPAALWQAFCAGAGIRPDSQAGSGPESMRVAGSMLRAAVDGSLQLMAVRAALRHELRARVTEIEPRIDNPLTFAPDAQSALEQLLRPPLRGCLDGPAAMTDAMSDLVGHAIGTMAGMRAALEGGLDRFAPQSLEAELGNKSMLDSLLPMNRKAELWELYLQQAQRIRGEARDDVEALFGKAFVAAFRAHRERPQAAASIA